MKKIVALVTAIILTFSLCGCSNKGATANTQSDATKKANAKYGESLTLLYSASDTFNPYDAKTTVNRQICKLLYEPLVKTDNSFEPHNSLAANVKIQENVCTVKLKSVKFSDGTKLTADDVIYSFKLAKNTATAYKYKLYSVKKVVAKDENTLVFTLSQKDPYFANVLDFPIIKEKSDKAADSDSVKYPPIGAGRYKLNKDNTALVQNEHYHGEKGSIKNISLINAPDDESISHYVEIGATDIYYSDISDGQIFRMSGSKTAVNLNNLVYIGVNHNNDKLALNELRQALSTGIDRSKICKNAYYNNALAATGFFNPLWEETKSLQNIQITSNLQITVENLGKIGYNELDKDGVRRNKNDALRFSLLVNKENTMRVSAADLIASQLKESGIHITVVKVSYKEYLKRLKKGEFDLYLGEINITENMDLSQLVMSDGTAAYGIKLIEKNETDQEDQTQETVSEETEQEKPTEELLTCANIIKGFYKGKNSIGDVAVTLQSDMPVIPVCYRTGVLFTNENIESIDATSESDIYFSIESYKFKMD